MPEDKKIEVPKGQEASKLTPKQMEEWNKFQSWMKEKGFSGDPRMNNMDFSQKVVRQYQKENPSSPISYAIVGDVQKAIREYRDSVIENVKAGKVKLTEDPGQNFERFMPWVTKTPDDAFLGEFTSQFTFPSRYISDKYTKSQGEGETLERQGFAPPSAQTTPMPPAATQRVANQASYGQFRKLGTRK